MPNGLEFIRENPFTKAFRSGQQAVQTREVNEANIARSRFDLEEAQRKSEEQRAIDEAIRGGLGRFFGRQQPPAAGGVAAGQPPAVSGPPQGPAAAPVAPTVATGGPVAPAAPAGQPAGLRGILAQELSQVPGGGLAAAEMSLSELDRQQEIIEQTFEIALENPDAAEAFAARNGMPLPPELQAVIRDRSMSQAIANLFGYAKEIYPGTVNTRQRWQFIQTSLEAMIEEMGSQGQGAAAPAITPQTFTREGLPEPAAEESKFAPNFQIYPGFDTQGNSGTYIFDTRTGETEFRPGEDINRFASQIRGGTLSVFEQKRQAWLAVNTGDEAGALEYASGRARMSDANLRVAARRLAVAEARLQYYPPSQQEIDAHAREIYEILVSGSEQISAPIPQPQAESPGAEGPGFFERNLPFLYGGGEEVVPETKPATQSPAVAPEYATPQTQEEYDALPSGTTFMDPGDGLFYTKP
mgnify:CR=1 FL=1